MKFTTSAATIGLYREWGERYNLNELVLAVAIIHWTNFRKWKFDSSKGMFFYPSKQISFSQLVKNINMSESTAHLHCNKLKDNTRPFFIEFVKQTGRGGLFNLWCAPTENQQAEATKRNGIHQSGHREPAGRLPGDGEQTTESHDHIKNSNESKSLQMGEEEELDSLQFIPSDPYTKRFLPFKQIKGWAEMTDPEEREFIEPDPECEQTLRWMFRCFNSWFGLGPPERRIHSYRLSNTQCEKLLLMYAEADLDEADEPEFVQECIREFEEAAAKGKPWENVYSVLKFKIQQHTRHPEPIK